MVELYGQFAIGEEVYVEGKYNGKFFTLVKENGCWQDCIGNLQKYEFEIIKNDIWF